MILVDRDNTAQSEYFSNSQLNGYLVFDKEVLSCTINQIDIDAICIQSGAALPILEEGLINITFRSLQGSTVLNDVPVEVRSSDITEDSGCIDYKLDVLLGATNVVSKETRVMLELIRKIIENDYS